MSEGSKDQAKAQYDSIVELVEALRTGGDDAVQAIHEDALQRLGLDR